MESSRKRSLGVGLEVVRLLGCWCFGGGSKGWCEVFYMLLCIWILGSGMAAFRSIESTLELSMSFYRGI